MMRRAIRVFLALVLVGIFLLAALGILLHLGGARWAVNRVLKRVNPYPGTSLEVGSVGGNLLQGAEVRDIEFRTAWGDVPARVEWMSLRYALADLLSDEITIDEVRLAGATVHLKRSPDGTWELARKPAGKPGEAGGSSPRIRVRRLLLEDVSVTAAAIRIANLGLRARELVIAGGVEVGLDTIAFQIRAPEPHPALRVAGAGSFQSRRLTVRHLGIASASSSVAVRGSAVFLGGGIRGVREIMLEAIAPKLTLSDLQGVNRRFDRAGAMAVNLRATGSAEHLSFRLAARLDAGGGTLEATGAGPLPGAGPGRYSIEARARQLDVARLVGGKTPSEPMDAEVHAELSGESLPRLDGDVRLRLRGPVTAALDARFVDGEADIGLTGAMKASHVDFRGKVRPFDSLPRYRLAGTWHPPSRAAGGRFSPVHLRIDGRGREANVGTALQFAGGAVNADGRLTLGSPLRYAITRGTFDRVGFPEGASLTGRFTLRGGGVEPSSIVAQARVALLSSTVAGRRIDSLGADLSLRASRLDLRALGMIEGTSVSLEADARPFEPLPAVRLQRVELHGLELQQLFPGLGVTTDASVVASGSLARGVATIHAEVRDSSGRLTLAANARPLDTVPSLELQEIRLEDVNLARILQDSKFETRLRGRLTGRARGTSVRDADATATLEVSGSEVRGKILRSGHADLALAGGTLRLFAAAAVDADSLEVTGKMDSSGAVVHATGSVRGARLDSAGARLSLGEGRRRLDTLWVQSSIGTISGSGTPTNLRVAGLLTDITPIGRLLGLDSLATDSLSFTAGIGGPDDSLALNVAGRAHDLVVNANRVAELDLSLVGRVSPSRRSLDSGTGTLTLQRFARGGTAVESAAVQAAYTEGEVGITAEAVVDRDRSGRIVGRWIRADCARIHLDSVDVRTLVGSWALAHPVDIRYGARLMVDDLVLASGTQRIAVNGVVDRRGEQSLHASLDSVRFGPFAELVGLRNLDGLAAGTFDLRGPADSPHAVGNLSITFLSKAKRMGRARGAVDWDSRGLRLDLGLFPAKGDSLTVAGDIPVALSLLEGDTAHGAIRPLSSGRLAVDARTNAFRLETLEALLKSEDIAEVKGLLSMDIAFRGTTEEPLSSGSVRLKDVKVNAPGLGATYKGTAEATLSGRELRLTSATLRAGGGEADATGALRLEDSARVGLDIDAMFREFQIAAAKDFGSKLSGRIHLGGTSTAPALSGKVTTDNAYFYLTAGKAGGAVADVELTPEELEMVERRFGSLVRKRDKPGLIEASALDLDLTMGPNNWIRRRSDPVVAVELKGELGIKKQPGGKLDVRGDVEALTGRSFVETVGRRFELTRGGAQLSGPLETAKLDLEAEYRVASAGQAGESNVTITAEVTADTGSIAVTLGSRPSMDQRDIMSYLLTGAPATTDPTLQSASNPNALSTGASLAVGAALGTIAGSAGQELGFDVVQILQDLQGAQTLVAGKYVSPDLYIGFRQPLSEATTNDEDPDNTGNVMEFEVEYAAFRKVLLNLQGAGSEFRVFLRLRGGN